MSFFLKKFFFCIAIEFPGKSLQLIVSNRNFSSIFVTSKILYNLLNFGFFVFIGAISAHFKNIMLVNNAEKSAEIGKVNMFAKIAVIRLLFSKKLLS